jgi:hypothetical protein
MVVELERASDPDAGPSPAAARARRARRTERAG